MDITKIISLMLYFILGVFCLQQRMKKIEDEYVYFGPMDNFYNVKMESLYQCMELCLQFTACIGVTYYSNTCYLHNDDAMIDKCRCGNSYWDRRRFPDHILGACLNHNCSMDTRCLAITGTNNHVCVPHGLSTFTCPKHWLRHNKSCFRAFFVNVTWQSAFDQCKLENAALIELHDNDTEEYITFILSHFSNPGMGIQAYNKPGGQLYWTALTNEVTDGKWIWRVSGKVLPVNTKWTVNAISQMSVPGNDCVGLSLPDAWRWKPVNCNKLFFYVCEKLMVT